MENNQSALRGDLLAKDAPRDVRTKSLASHASRALDRGAVLRRNVASRLPHAWEALGNRDRRGERSNATGLLDCFLQGRQGCGFEYHERDCAPITNVMQAEVLITLVKNPHENPDLPDNLHTIAKRLIWARERADLTQEALAEHSGVTQGTIGNVEAGLRTRPRGLVAIARALKVSPSWLETGEGSPDIVVIDGQHRLFAVLKTHGLDAIAKDADQLRALAGDNAVPGDTVPGQLDDPSARNDRELRLLRAFRRILDADRSALLDQVERRRSEVGEIAKQILEEKFHVKGAASDAEVEAGFRRAQIANGTHPEEASESSRPAAKSTSKKK